MDQIKELKHPIFVGYFDREKNHVYFKKCYFAKVTFDQLVPLEMDTTNGYFKAPVDFICILGNDLPKDWTEICQKTLETKAKS